MNDAHISAQIEQLEMVLDRILNDCDKMQIELGRLKALVRLDPPAVEPWQTEDVQPVTGDTNPFSPLLTDDTIRILDKLIEDVPPVTGGRPIKCVSCGQAVAAWDDLGNRGWYCLTCRTAYEETGR